MINEYNKTLCDIDLILNELDENERNKIPKKLRKLIQENKLEDYNSNIDTSIPLEEQELSENTKAFLAMLYLNYWCTSENEKNEIIGELTDNEAQYQKELSEKYSVDKLFVSKQKEVSQEEKQAETKELIPYKESIIKKILNKIFSFFRRK